MNATRFVMDYLRQGPEPLEEMCRVGWERHRYTKEQLAEAAGHLSVRCRRRVDDDTTWFAFLPDNLYLPSGASWAAQKSHRVVLRGVDACRCGCSCRWRDHRPP